MTPPDLGSRLRAAGLRPTLGRQTILGLMLTSEGKPLCCEDLYRLAMATRRSLNWSSIAHSLADLERAGFLSRATVKDDRRLYYRLTAAQPKISPLILQVERDGRLESIDDPRFAQQLHQWLAQLGVSTADRDRVVIRVERAEAPTVNV